MTRTDLITKTRKNENTELSGKDLRITPFFVISDFRAFVMKQLRPKQWTHCAAGFAAGSGEYSIGAQT